MRLAAYVATLPLLLSATNLSVIMKEVDGARRLLRLEIMPDEQRVANNSQTYLADADTFNFETIEQDNGQATVIRFRLDDARYQAGDILLVLSGTEIHFHGMIGRIEDGWATASDHRGSLLPATVQ